VNAPARLRSAQALSHTELVVDGLRCASCIAKLEQGMPTLDGVAEARVNFTTKRLSVAHEARIGADCLVAGVRGLGFEAHALADARLELHDPESRRLARALAVASFAAMNVMLLSVSVWSGADGATRALFHWLSALIALPAIAYAGRPFFDSAWRALRAGRTNMDVPISIGVVLTCAMSLYETATAGPHAYFDGAIMLLAFLLGGRLLDSVMRERAQGAVASLLRKLPDSVRVIATDGSMRDQPAASVTPGMLVLVAAGDRIGVDGVVEIGTSDVDRSIVTGESASVPVAAGDAVLAGTFNLTSALTVRVSAAAADTVVADIARLMEVAGQHKSRYVRIADRASRLYAPAVHLLAALSLVGWLIAGAGWHNSLLIAVAVLIITCPCALGLAVPVAQVVCAGALMRRGILVRDGAALEKLAAVDTVLLDKTGTVTLGRLVPIAGMPVDERQRSILLTLARTTRHPHAKAIAVALEADGAIPVMFDALHEYVGSGVEAKFDGQVARLGKHAWVTPNAARVGTGGVSTSFAIDDGPVFHILLADAPRPDAAAAIARLKQRRLQIQFVSGDAWQVVAPLARQLGVFARACMSPADKHAAVSRLEASGKSVLMVGDGVNDGPALKAASVAMAPAAASEVGRQASDILFFGDRLMAVPIAVAAARRTMRVVRQNFVLAIGYNVLAVPLALAGQVTPLVAALAMSGSSILVVVNALRLRSAAR
jgi:Cu2+-exporting ATPase